MKTSNISSADAAKSWQYQNLPNIVDKVSVSHFLTTSKEGEFAYFDVKNFKNDLEKHGYIEDDNYRKRIRSRKVNNNGLPQHRKNKIVQKKYTCKNTECSAEILVGENRKFPKGLFCPLLNTSLHADICFYNKNVRSSLNDGEISKKGEENLATCKNVEALDAHPVTEIDTHDKYLKEKSTIYFNQMAEMIKNIDKILSFVTNRNQSITLAEVKSQVEGHSKKDFETIILNGILSVCPNAYSLDLANGEIMIQVGNNIKHMTPEVVRKRRMEFNENMREEKEKSSKYIKLVGLPRLEKRKYLTAVEFLQQNVVPEPIVEPWADRGEVFPIQNLSIPQKLINKINENAKRRIVREKMVEEKRVIWEKEKLEQIARKVNTVFVKEHKRPILYDTLVDKVRMGYEYPQDKKKMQSEVEKFIKKSKGWVEKITVRNQIYLKMLKPDKDINIVVNEMFINK